MKYFTPTKISEHISETPEGFLVCIGVPIARTGEMIYGKHETPLEADAQGKVVIVRDESEVFRPETIASFEGKPITITHPVEFVSPDNWNELAKGTMQNVRRGEGEFSDSLIADLLITDKDAINLVKSGLREVSCGYEADYSQIEVGKGKQTNIIGNHLALVDQGRAGSHYAITDSKEGKGSLTMKFKDKVKAIFAKAQDEAMKMVDDAESEKENPQDPSTGKPSMPAHDDKSWDELHKMVTDLGEKMEKLMGAKKSEDDKAKDDDDDKVHDDDDKEKEEEVKDDDDAEGDLESRLKRLEAAVSKLLEREAKEDEVSVTDDDDDEVEDDDFEESTMTGDSISRAEILAPGIAKTKDIKKQALMSFYKTKDGKAILEALSLGKKPDFKSQKTVDQLFVSASEVVKQKRAGDLAKTKVSTGDSVQGPKVMTADMINEINAKYYKRA